MPRFSDPEPLGADHILDGFDCGQTSLNLWLSEHAGTAAAAGSARTYVISDSQQERVVGYHALTAASLERESATARTIKGMPRYPVPVVLLARLAVDSTARGRGLGASLLGDAMTRAVAASKTVGIRAMLVHALDPEARAFYLHPGLEASPTDPLHLMVLIKDIEAAIRASAPAR